MDGSSGGHPLSGADSTRLINEIAKDENFTLVYKLHAKEQMSDRNIVASDVLFVLRNGIVKNPAQASTRENYFKYRIECKTPNSDSRKIGVIAIPDSCTKTIKLVTIMWVDENETRAGSFLTGDEK